MMRILAEDEVGLVTSTVSFICGMWLLFDDYMIIIHYFPGVFIKALPFFSLILFPLIAILIGITSIILDVSLLGILAIVLNVVALIIGKSALLIVYRIISKTG